MALLIDKARKTLSELTSEMILNNLILHPDIEIGRGAYGRVFKVQYCEMPCAAKEIHITLINGVNQAELERTVELFLQECRQFSKLRHPNIVQFLGIYYPPLPAGRGMDHNSLPLIVMEMMAYSLTMFVKNHPVIPVHIKYSIVHDVSLGLCYLHNHDPPIVHRDLSPNNVLLTAHHVAKISDLGVAKVIKADSRKTMTKAPGTVDFMPPEALASSPVYGTPIDVFSFAGIILHTFNLQWPSPLESKQVDPETKSLIALSEVERRRQWLDKMVEEGRKLRPLVEQCLDDDPAKRPVVKSVCDAIKKHREDCSKTLSVEDTMILETAIEKLQNEKQHLEDEKQHLKIRNSEMEAQLAAQQLLYEANNCVRVMGYKEEAPPLLSAWKTGRYRMNWSRLPNLPSPLSDPYAVIHQSKIFVTGCVTSHTHTHAIDQVYCYDCPTNQWYRLPQVQQYYGVPHIVGGKLTIFGGRLSNDTRRTCKVSTFDLSTHEWTSFYPNMMSVRSRPGVVTHLEYVIVAGGTTDDSTCVPDIEILNWVENLSWRMVSLQLPFPMYAVKPTIHHDNLYIVGFSNKEGCFKNSYMVPAASIASPLESSDSKSWQKLKPPEYYHTAIIPGLSHPVIVGGHRQVDQSNKASTADICVYNTDTRTWRQVDKLSSPRSNPAVVTVSDNAVIVIGGSVRQSGLAGAVCLSTVELGQAKLINDTAM